MTVRSLVPVVLMVVGWVMVVFGVAWWSVPAALVVGGLLMVAAGILVDWEPRPQ